MKTAAPPASQPPELEILRSRIDAIDSGLIDLIAARLELSREALAIREANRLPREDLAHDAAVVRRASVLARVRGVEPEAARDMFWRLLDLSRSAPPAEWGLPENQVPSPGEAEEG